MYIFFIGIVILLVGVFALRTFATMDTQKLAKLIKKFGGVLVIALGGFMMMRGLAIIGLPVMAAGWAMMRGGFNLSGLFANRTQQTQGQQSRVRSAMLDMNLDHDSGSMDGTVLHGQFEGMRLSNLPLEKLRLLLEELQASGDGQSIALLEAYLDRMHSDWAGADHKRSSGQSGTGVNAALSRDDAYEILGLSPGATTREIKAAHRTLMQKLHPDHGGSTYLAAKINEAKDFLLG